MRYRRVQSDYRYAGKLAMVTVLVAGLFVTTALFARPTSTADQLWWASATQGEVHQQDGANGWRAINPGDAIPPGSRLRIGPRGRLILVRPDSFLNFPPNDQFTVPR